MNKINTTSIKTLIFDLDGVITSEQKYWNTARLTVWELICSPNYLGLSQYFGDSPDVKTRLVDVGERVISGKFIYELKSRAINSNWDLTFFVFCLQLLGLLTELKHRESQKLSAILNQNNVSITHKIKDISVLLDPYESTDYLSHSVIEQFWQETEGLTGATVLDYVNTFIDQKLGSKFNFFDPRGELWQLCYENFQAWYEGEKGYNLPDDETVLELKKIDSTLKALHNSGGYTLAIATGRPRNEVIQPLTVLGLLQYFDPERIVTYDEVLEAESILSEVEPNIKLGKPHPFILFKAIYPGLDVRKLGVSDFKLENGQEIAYVGDAGSDVVAAKKAGCISIGVLTGFVEDKAREKKQGMLLDLGCDVILDSILELPQLLGVSRN
jgi:phosphoglycolate phosphatase-like HAD superfamily hydrolase